MKLIILKNNLLEGLTAVERSVGENVNLPILKNILLKADGNKIILTATNLELATRYLISGKIIENGEITVLHSVFMNIVRNLPAERITLENKEKQLLITAENYEAVVQGQDPREYPIIPTIQNKKEYLKIAVSVLSDALAKVVVAVQFSDIRPEISGIFFRYSNQTLTLVGTDGFRLTEKRLEANRLESTVNEASVIVPLKTANELLRILKTEEDLSVFFDPNQILFKTQNLEIISHLIDGHFPEYQAIVPKQLLNEAVLSRIEFMNAVKLTSAFAGRSNDITVKVGDNKKFLEIYCASSALGENRYRVPIKLKGDKFSAAFNWRYLLDGLKIYESEEITLGVNSGDKAVVIKNQNEANQLYVLMPIRA
ncbi:MAG: polymerase III, beta subunit protein [Candidatus Jorgensenbacteria bacterium GW2011_GWA1_48_11]|uniref:Beta sliding clamp n=1 Tax=Candidatus Jorgensenbacteria bacterium GW2011_GWA1_48_11 TaxID=1618660 RepID=A0A0G1UBM6_9BACT|nr:MAG: polymerase III, beta subunit protein [Candidatus Jorgensenbacteria bacterium GW2011_GWA1_48_11]KKW12059.1 MAG: polymerase III, beta subunit protein [Candidatus Jorgensenbacteria bacterium GW2011_GWB1_49_9]